MTESQTRWIGVPFKTVEFANQPSKDWFLKIKEKYFDRDPDLRNADPNEPGVFPSKK